MLSAPPPNNGLAGFVAMEIVVVERIFCEAMWLRSSVFGSSSIFWVMVPAAMKLVKSWGMRAVPLLLAVRFAKTLGPGGLMVTAGIVGGPLAVDDVPCARKVLPCGIDAIRTSVCPSAGSVVDPTAIHRPGST